MSSGSEQIRPTNQNNYEPVLRVIAPKCWRQPIFGAQPGSIAAGRREKHRSL